MNIKLKGTGTLIAIGGNEDKAGEMKVLRRVVKEAKGAETRVEVVTTASEEPGKMAYNYEKVFKAIGIKSFGVLDINSRYGAADRSLEKRILEADLIFFTGGDQLRLSSILGGSFLLDVIRRHFHEGAVIAGTSAGAAALPDTMIYDGESLLGLVKGSVSMGPGLGFINNVVVDTHLIDRGRIGRLFQVVATNPSILGVGLSEDTGIILRDEHVMEVFGSGLVILVDGSHLKNSNISRINKGGLISVENFHVHSLVEGCCYDFWQRKFL